MWFVYVLHCSNNSLYTGISTDPNKRFLDHKNGTGGKYTRSFPPLKIIYLEKMSTKSTALKREAEIKKWSRAKKIQELRLTV